VGTTLSAAQERLWVLDQLHARNPAQNLACGLRIPGSVNRSSIEAALNVVVGRHEILWTEFRAIDGVPTATVLPTALVTVNVVDLGKLSGDEQKAQITRVAQIPFDLSRAPLLKATLFALNGGNQIFLLVVHRIVCDELSLQLLLNEIASRIVGDTQKHPRPAQYGPIATRATPASEAAIAYWRQRLAGAPSTIDLPSDRQRPPVQTFRGSKQRLQIESDLVERLKKLGQSRDTDLFAVLLSAFKVLLLRYTRQDDVVVGMRVSGRHEPEVDTLIGPLENLIALRTDVSADPSFVDLLNRVREGIGQAFAHQDVPFETLLRELRLERDMSRHPLFQVTFTLQEKPYVIFRNTPIPANMSAYEVELPTELCDLSIECVLRGNKLAVVFSYNTDLFDASTIGRMMDHFRNLLESAAQSPEIQISRMTLIGPDERHQLLVAWNDTQTDYPTDVALHKFIENQVAKSPDAIALVFESQQLTYRELNQRANQLAQHLKRYGVGPDVLVGVCAERSLELVIALLATVKADGAYVPLDPEYPKDRLQTMLSDANAPVVLTQAHLLDRLPQGTNNVFCLDRDWPSLKAESQENLPICVTPKNLAYAIYTSGSTGKPKGVPNVHEGIVNRLLWMQEMYRLTPRDRVLQKTPFSFDVSVWEFFWPLMTGATLVVARPGGHRDAAYMVDLIARQGITTMHFVPSMLNIFLETPGMERCDSLRLVFASGEALPYELQQRFFERLGAELHNLYGPTEAAVDVTFWACRPDNPQTIVPIGRPIANTQIYILDAALQPTPIGVAGELHIGGIGLARGYLNRPDLTAQKFIPDPFSQRPGARLYKTGDLARFLPDGNIEYLGRIDHQVKLRGFRIELGEIEAVLGECTGILQAVATVREDIAGNKQLVAYVIATPNEDLDVDLLRQELKDKLPEYMVPSRFVVVKEFPMTTSGKVDRKLLPAPPLERRTAAEVVAPRNELEAQVAPVFARILGLPSVGVTDNFFELGGQSLLAGRLLAEIQKITGRQIPLSALFRGATVEALAGLIAEESEVGRDPVVMEIQHGESDRLAFFAIVPPGEESIGYAMLARHMGPGQTVFKVQGHAPVTRGKRPYTEEEMRALSNEYIGAIRSVQPHGPYCVGGLCDGTHICERIILDLEAQDEEIALFAIFDTWVLQHTQIRWLWKVHYYGERLRQMKGMKLGERFASYGRAVVNRVQDLGGDRGPTHWQKFYWPEGFTAPRFRAPVVLFKRPKQPFYYVDDPLMGWGQRTQSGVEIYEVDLDHMEILREPHVRVFGETLAQRIAQIKPDVGLVRDSASPESTLIHTSPQAQSRS
jgi:amino acid adenylation domain-containing protein